jgi:hypothetical protein
LVAFLFIKEKSPSRKKQVIGGNKDEKKWKKNFIVYLDGSYGICVIAGI